ncbi:MAG: Hint domain-containing protein, partial [Planctomycetes bacterium]|nr:Hint domain-containing protein [Planctomycetota bacterium]
MRNTPRAFHRLAGRILIILALASSSRLAWARGGGGCLEEGTPISTPAGEIPIEKLRPGDAVWSIGEGGPRPARVLALYRVEPEEYRELLVAGRTIRLTSEHLAAAAPGLFFEASSLKPGQAVLVFRDGRIDRVAIKTSRAVQAERPAYNLLVMPGETFFAGGLAVHNKGCFLPDTPIRRDDGREIPL